MCCPGKTCMLCLCVILVGIAIGLIFGFGVFENGFHKLKDMIHHICDTSIHGSLCQSGRPFLGYAAPPPFYH